MSILTELPEPLYLGRRPTFSTAGTGFTIDNARAMAWVSQLAYETNDPDKVRRILADWGWTLRGFHAGRVSSALRLMSAKGFIAARDGVSILAFAGTEPVSFADWISDLSIHKNADGVHSGFGEGVNAVWDAIAGTLGAGGSAAHDRLLIAGHSLGAALSAVAALRLVRDGVVALERILGIYAYGMPRVGDDRFARDYRAAGGRGLATRTYRIIYGVDLVPQVPPPEAPFAFRHVGAKLACEHGKAFDPATLVPDAPEQVPAGQTALLDLVRSVFRNPAKQDLPGFPGDWLAALGIDQLPPPLRDHLMDRYLGALGAL